MLECEILQSMCYYPRDIEEFLKKSSLKPFSKKGQQILFIILNLANKNSNDAISNNAILSALPPSARDDEFVIEFLSATPNPRYIDYVGLFINQYKLKLQEMVAKELQNASNNGVEIDLQSLIAKYEITQVEYKTFGNLYDEWENKAQSPQYPTGIKFFDWHLNGGFELGQLMLLGGDPEAGKTTLGLQILENLAKKTKVCFFCFEFTKDSYFKTKKARGFSTALRDNMIIIDDGYSIMEVANNIKALAKQGVKFFLIDSQMRVTNTSGRNIEEEESNKFSILARLCHHLNIFVILIIQTAKGDRFNPSNSKKGAHESSISVRIELDKPDKDDLMQAGKEWDEHTRTVIIYKNKQTGKHNKEKLAFNNKKGIFGDIEVDKNLQTIEKAELLNFLEEL